MDGNTRSGSKQRKEGKTVEWAAAGLDQRLEVGVWKRGFVWAVDCCRSKYTR